MKSSLISLFFLALSGCTALPHFRSFDGENFDFQGYGEFVAFCGKVDETVDENLANCSPDNKNVLSKRGVISVNYRLAKIEPSDTGTTTVGVAIEDPRIYRGKKGLVIHSDRKARLAVHIGNKLVEFPRKKKKKILRKKISGAKIFMTSDVNSPDFHVRVLTKSGLIIRIRENDGGITAGFLKIPSGSNTFVGLMGIPDNDSSNDLTGSDGIVYVNEGPPYNGACKFGKTWMVPQKKSSLFKALLGSLDFDNFHFPAYLTCKESLQM